MKNVVILSYINPKSARGIQIVALNYAKILIENGYKVTLFSKGDKVDKFYIDNIEINTYKTSMSKNIIKKMIEEFRNIKKAWDYHYKDENISTINGHDYLSYLIVSKIINKNIKKIFTVHDPLVYHQKMLGKLSKNKFNLKNIVFKQIEKSIEKNSDITYVISNYTNNRMFIKKEINNLDRKLVYNWIDIKKFDLPKIDKMKIRRELGIDKEKFIVLTIRGLEKRMGLDNLIKGFHLFNKEIDKSMLLIGGKGPEEKNLKNLTNNINNTNIKFLGYIPDDLLVKYYQIADVFVLPSIDGEGFGLPLLESLACGTSVLGTPICAIPEVLKFNQNYILKGVEDYDIYEGLLKRCNENVDIRENRKFVISNYSPLIHDLIEDFN